MKKIISIDKTTDNIVESHYHLKALDSIEKLIDYYKNRNSVKAAYYQKLHSEMHEYMDKIDNVH